MNIINTTNCFFREGNLSGKCQLEIIETNGKCKVVKTMEFRHIELIDGSVDDIKRFLADGGTEQLEMDGQEAVQEAIMVMKKLSQ